MVGIRLSYLSKIAILETILQRKQMSFGLFKFFTS